MTDHAAEARKLLQWAHDDTGEGVTNEAANLFCRAATAHALLALVETLGQPAAGACHAYLRVGPIFAGEPDQHVYCQHPHGHTGLHANNPDHNPNQLESRWTDWAEGAARLDEDTTAETPTNACGYKWHAGHDTVRCTKPSGHPGKHEHHGDPE